jgi:lycopene cyclase domain-containing protein
MQSSPYLFLELAIVVFFLGFGWEHWNFRRLNARVFWLPASGLACIWFAIDVLAIRLGLWAFPENGTFPIRIFSLPLEEYLLCCFFYIPSFASSSWNAMQEQTSERVYCL